MMAGVPSAEADKMPILPVNLLLASNMTIGNNDSNNNLRVTSDDDDEMDIELTIDESRKQPDSEEDEEEEEEEDNYEDDDDDYVLDLSSSVKRSSAVSVIQPNGNTEQVSCRCFTSFAMTGANHLLSLQ